jgi:hypothetical protein
VSKLFLKPKLALQYIQLVDIKEGEEGEGEEEEVEVLVLLHMDSCLKLHSSLHLPILHLVHCLSLKLQFRMNQCAL